jgi:hypothetical protein
MNVLLCDFPKTAQRTQSLNKYFRENVLNANKFICPFDNECRDSQNGIFFEGQLHHVGNHYDLSISGHPFRILVVGQEYGHGPSHVLMDDRSQMVFEQTGLMKTFTNRNPHMRGTTSVLRLLFNIPLGENQAEEFLQSTDGGNFHIFDAFSLVNYLLCSAISESEGRRGKSTPKMRENCMAHFKKAVEILEPTVMIIQGKTYWSSIQNVFSNLVKISDNLFSGEINLQRKMIAVFAHPSTPDNEHNWGRDAKTQYLLGTVVPTIKAIHWELFGSSTQKGDFIMPPPPKTLKQLSISNSEYQSYDVIFEEIKAGLIQRFKPEFAFHKPDFDHSTPNRMRIYPDRNLIKGSHYEICFRQKYFEFALHFESTSEISLERRQAFDSHLQELTKQVGTLVRSGPLENKGWMRIWYEQKREPIDKEKILLFIDQYSRFIAATFPILSKIYSLSV